MTIAHLVNNRCSGIMSDRRGVFGCDGCAQQMGRDQLQRCSGCALALYCGVECQKAAWSAHKSECKRMRKMRQASASGEIPYMARWERVRRFCMKNQWPEAEAECKLMLVEDPSDSGIWGNLGRILEAQGDMDGAVRSLRRSVEFGPDRSDNRYNLGVTLMACGRFEEALACHDAALRLDPSQFGAAQNRARCLDMLRYEPSTSR